MGHLRTSNTPRMSCLVMHEDDDRRQPRHHRRGHPVAACGLQARRASSSTTRRGAGCAPRRSSTTHNDFDVQHRTSAHVERVLGSEIARMRRLDLPRRVDRRPAAARRGRPARRLRRRPARQRGRPGQGPSSAPLASLPIQRCDRSLGQYHALVGELPFQRRQAVVERLKAVARPPCTLPNVLRAMMSRSRAGAGRREPPTAPCVSNTWGDLCPDGSLSMDAQWGGLRRRARVQGPAGIVGAPVRFGKPEVGLEAEVVRGCRLGLATASGVRARRRRAGARRAGVRAWRCRAVGAGRLVAVVHGWRGRGNRRGGRDAARTGGREPDGTGFGVPLHQSEAARPLPGSLLAGGREGRPARCTGSGLGVADRPSLPAAPGVDRPEDHRIARVVAPQRNPDAGAYAPREPDVGTAVALLPAVPRC